jgi:hypothetical protein
MERTVPSTASEEIDLYQRTYYSLLRSTAEVQLRTLEEAHARMKSLLHPGAREPTPDMSAFLYSIQRLPGCMPDIQLVVLGQSSSVFKRCGFGDVEAWEQISAPARRRRCFYNGKNVLACYIASRSDIDDVIPLLTAFQIEWNKCHTLLQVLPDRISISDVERNFEVREQVSELLKISMEDLDQLAWIWGDQFACNLGQIAARPSDLRIQLLSGSMSEYWRATRIWWDNIERTCPKLDDSPVYVISSNPHSIVNLLSGYALSKGDELIEFLEKPGILERSGNLDLLDEWVNIKSEHVPSSRENFLYYVFKQFLQTQGGRLLEDEMTDHERALGIQRIQSLHSFDVEAQIIRIKELRQDFMDPRLGKEYLGLAQSDALILNIDYPLGLAAYHILSKIAEQVDEILGVYVTGKAATLNGVIGDVMIPNVVHDEQSRNTYLFSNAFNASHVVPYIAYGAVLDNQKAVSVRGTFLQNERYMDVFYREGYTDIEMEAGPYLSAVYEMFRPQRHPINEIVNLYGLPFDLGILHYASDTPLGKGRNLGAGSLSYYGMDSTYGAGVAILRRIFSLEHERLGTQRHHH